MNAFVKKEIRLLLPNFAFACGLALVALFFPNNRGDLFNGLTYFLVCVFCPAVAVMLALSPFGVEVSAGTFANLLAQPVSRLKIWEAKITLLALAMVSVAVLWVVAFLFSAFSSNTSYGIKDWLDLFTLVITFGLVIFSGGLWTVLLLRQVAAAFWFTLLVPGVLLMILAALFSDQDGNFFAGMIVSVLGFYSLTGFFFARWLFLRAQDVQWSGGNIVLPELRGLARFRASARARRDWRPRAALWRKEFLLHQSQLIMAFALLVLHLGVLAARQFLDLTNSPELKFVLETFWGLWFVLPLLVGCAAVAEERKLGTLEGQLCQPVKRRTQFVVKFLVVMFLSALLGAVMPLLLEGTRILPGASIDLGTLEPGWQSEMSAAQINFWVALEMINGLLPLLALLGIVVLTGGVSLYVSSLARNTLQTLAPAVLGIMLMFFLLAAAGAPWWRQYEFDFLWRGPLAHFIAVPVVLLTLFALTYKNFQQVKTSARQVGRNVLILVVALGLGVVATSALYHRVWEKLTPFEPPPGAARLSRTDSVQLKVWWAEANVRLPDGKIWTARFGSDAAAASPMTRLLGNVTATLENRQFYRGSNWVSLTRYGRELVGIKTDGTLWISEAPISSRKLRHDGWKAVDERMRNLARFGDETNWSSALPMYLSALLVKTDGTLWRLGTNQFDEKHHEWPGLRTFIPYRLGNDSDWATTTWDYSSPFTLQKNNGSIWISQNDLSRTNGLVPLEIEPGFSVVQLYDGRHGQFRSLTQIQHGLQFKVGIREDGTFRLWADMQLDKGRRTYEFAPADLQIGNGTNWVAVAGRGEKIVTLKSDGTLWLWDFRTHFNLGWSEGQPEEEVLKTVPTRLGSRADWLAISGDTGGLVALAADGSVWFWPVDSVENYYNSGIDKPTLQPLLDVSRKPQWLGNIFSKVD